MAASVFSIVGGGMTSQNAWVVNVCCGQVEADGVDDVLVGQVALLVGDHLLGDLELAEEEGGAGQRTHACLPGDQDVLVGLHLGVVGAVEVVDEDGASLQVEALHEVAPAEMQVDGAGMGEAEDAFALHVPDDLAAARLDDDELLVRGGAQADLGGGGVRPGPDQAVVAPPQAAGLRQPLGRQQALLRRSTPRPSA